MYSCIIACGSGGYISKHANLSILSILSIQVNTAIMGSWYPAKGRGFIFGLWTCHQYIGDIAAAIFSAYILRSGYDWRLCIIVPAIVNGIWAFVNFYSVPSRPEDVGLELPNKNSSSSTKSSRKESGKEAAPPPIGFLQAFQLPNVLNYAIAFGFFKLVCFDLFSTVSVLAVHDIITFNLNFYLSICVKYQYIYR